jgi:alkanesulfonate monooxygenase SsuD/methylene tetrahydromethanopterin reductase-like flavin-dependent oxidoreductase (luciferase family)
LKLAAQYADAVNLIAGRDELAHKIEVLAKHCADAGRDLASISKSWLGTAIVGATEAEAEAMIDARVKAMGMESWASLDDGVKAMLTARLLVGTPASIAASVEEIISVGLDGVILNFPSNHTPAGIEAVAATGRAIRAAIG